MIYIKTKILIIVMAFVLFVNSYDLRVFASGASHEQLMEYDGYAEALYESIVEEKAFLAGAYTDNREYVSQIMGELKTSASSLFNEMINIEGPTDIYEKIFSAGATAGEWIKRLFDKFNQKEQERVDLENTAINFGAPLEEYFRLQNGNVSPKSDYIVTYGTKTLSSTYNYAWGYDKNVTVNLSYCPTGSKRITRIYFTGDTSMQRIWCGNDSVNGVPLIDSLRDKILASDNKLRDTLHAIVVGTNGSFTITHKATNQRVDVDFPPIKENPFITVKNFVDNETVPTKLKPLSATLVCPDGNRISIRHDGSTFLDKNGKVMQVAKDGTAVIESGVCHTEWNKPNISYDPTGKVIVEQDGLTSDLETGEDIEFDDEIEDGCGTICAIGKMLTGLGSIAKAIAAIPLKILDGLFELIKKILIPEENFWDSNLGQLKDKFFKDEVKEVQQGIDGLTSAGGGQFGDVTGSLMGVDNLKIVDSSSINMSLDTLHSWVRGFFYPLLLFFNINQMYRVIRGTSLVGIGGKKDE